MRLVWAGAAVLTLAACDSYTEVIAPPPGGILPPVALYYQVEPIGTGTAPSGLLLSWPDDGDPNLAVWHVYPARPLMRSAPRPNTSNTYHDNGPPTCSTTSPRRTSTVSRASARPSRSTSASPAGARVTLQHHLDGAIAPTDRQRLAPRRPVRRVPIYSGVRHRRNPATDWYLEGTTVAPEFIAGALPNGQPRCFAVTAVSVEGYESLWSPIRADTPRPDARNVVMYARELTLSQSGFRFWKDLNVDQFVQPSELGLIGPGNAPDIDFVASGTVWAACASPGARRHRRRVLRNARRRPEHRLRRTSPQPAANRRARRSDTRDERRRRRLVRRAVRVTHVGQISSSTGPTRPIRQPELWSVAARAASRLE
jgi:hypothetical protein